MGIEHLDLASYSSLSSRAARDGQTNPFVEVFRKYGIPEENIDSIKDNERNVATIIPAICSRTVVPYRNTQDYVHWSFAIFERTRFFRGVEEKSVSVKKSLRIWRR